jgi:hypothetical protein
MKKHMSRFLIFVGFSSIPFIGGESHDPTMNLWWCLGFTAVFVVCMLSGAWLAEEEDDHEM